MEVPAARGTQYGLAEWSALDTCLPWSCTNATAVQRHPCCANWDMSSNTWCEARICRSTNSLIRRLSDAWPSWQHSACSPSAQNKSERPGCQAGRQASQNATPTRSSPRHILSHTSICISTYILQSVSAHVYIDGKKQTRRKNKRARDRRADSRSLGYAQTPYLLGKTLLHAYFHAIALSPEGSGRERL